MSKTYSGYRLTETDASGGNANSIFASDFTINASATVQDLTITDGTDPAYLYGDGGSDSHIDPLQVVMSITGGGIETGHPINYEAIVRFSGSDGQTYTAIIFDYDEDGSNGVDNNNSDGLNDNSLFEEGFFIGFIGNQFDPTDNPPIIVGGPVPPPGTTLSRTAELLNTNQTLFICFSNGTEIQVQQDRSVAIEELRQGDLVMTADNCQKPIRWIGSKKLTQKQLRKSPNLRPIRIKAGALGDGTPSADLIVSPQHRILVNSVIAQRMFGQNEVLVSAKSLCLLEGIDVAEDVTEVTYYHFLLDDHEVVYANGAKAESLFTGPEALKAVSNEAREEILTIFPELAEIDYKALAARPLVSGRQGQRLAHRHMKNSKHLVANQLH